MFKRSETELAARVLKKKSKTHKEFLMFKRCLSMRMNMIKSGGVFLCVFFSLARLGRILGLRMFDNSFPTCAKPGSVHSGPSS